MIVSTVSTGVALGEHSAHWQSLVRRGMLFSECEGVEHWRLPADAELTLTPTHGVEEAVIVLAGRIALIRPDEPPIIVHTGQCALVPHGMDGRLRAIGAAELLTVRALPLEISRLLPPRAPQVT